MRDNFFLQLFCNLKVKENNTSVKNNISEQ